jgi:RimJ/RimL family protein N-acetyltransferase
VRVEPAGDIRLRPATPQDRFLLRRWVASPHFTWRDSAATAEAEITLAMGSSAAMPRIVERDGTPVGYAQAVEIGLWGASLPQSMPAGSWMIDYFLASSPEDGREVGSTVLKLLTQEVFSTTLAVACCSVVAISDEAAARSYERAGFRWLRVLQEPGPGLSWLMQLERPGQAP